MTGSRPPRSRRTVAAMAAGSLLLVLAGWQTLGNLIDFPVEDDEGVSLSAEQRHLASDIERLRADDGLFMASEGSAARPGLYESAHGLTVLRSATGRSVNIDVGAAELRRQFSDELQADPFTSRILLSQIEQASGKLFHTSTDVTTLVKYLNPEGYFQDPVFKAADVSSLLTDTSSALAALDQFGTELSGRDRARVRSWLATAAADAPGRPVQLYHLAHIADAVDAPLPDGLAHRAETWWREKATSTPRGEESVIEAAYYVLLAERLGTDLTADGQRLRNLLSPGQPVSTDPQVGSLTVRAWTVIDGPRKGLDAITERLRSRQLASGLFSSVQRRQGTLTSTFEVSRLRMAAGLPGSDPPLREALDAMRTTVLAKYDPLLRGAWLVLMDAAGGEVADRDRQTVVSALEASAPRDIDVRNVALWNRYTEVLTLLDAEVPEVSVAPWKPDTPEHRYARSLLINGLNRADRLETLSGRPRPQELAAEAEERLKTGTVRESAEAIEAAASLGWAPEPEAVARLTALLEERRTCPGAPTFYRDSAKDSECGVPGTRAGYRISALLEGAPTAGRTP